MTCPAERPRLRTATRADAATLLDLYGELARGDEPRLTADAVERFFAALGCYPSFRIFLAEFPGGATAIGTYSLIVIDNLAHGGRPLAVVENVVVRAACRGQGIGRAMMEHALAEARAAACYKVMLSSNLAREDAHRFYEHLGFSRHGVSFAVDIDT